MTSETDVAVIGAGAAGLAAGLRLAAADVAFEVIEAADHAGGRAETDTATLGVPVDLGCHWLHDARANPFAAIARSLGFALGRGGRDRTRLLHLGERFATGDEAGEAWREVDAAFDAVRTAGEEGRDVAAEHVLPKGGRFETLARHWLAFMSAADPADISTRDYALYHDSPDNWAVLGGFGALVLANAARVPVTLSCPVTRIDRSGARLALETARGRLSCRAAVVAVPTAVVASGRLGFFPALPHDLQEAFAALPLGVVEKVVLGFDRDVFGLPERSFLDAFREAEPEQGAISAVIRPGGAEGAVVHVAGGIAAKLMEEGEGAMVEHALDALAQVFGTALKSHVRVTRASRWAGMPFIGGAYSGALPGKAHLRARLAAPLDGRLFFAGEALGGPAFSTAHGAHLSGIKAADAALASLGAVA
ncbi:flavin monoamine oxidase family protein [Xanthobacter pseudotagetidis]|uniref:flavin monoamine oxidase family protein n=1 Tax=Xanthobacter pseudotagetidis TaxID=3119911 RepID=UPI00372B299D